LLLWSLWGVLYAKEGGSNEPIVSISPSKIYVQEGNSSISIVKVKISIDQCPDTNNIIVKYKSVDGSAKASENDYKEKEGSVTFYANSGCAKEFEIPFEINGDKEVEDDEYFYINIEDGGTSPEQSVKYQNSQTKVVIENDDIDMHTDLRIKKVVDHSSAVKGDTIRYTLFVKNYGPSAGRVKVVDEVPSEFEVVKVWEYIDDFSCRVEDQNRVICEGDKIFKKNEEKAIYIEAKLISNDSRADLENIARVYSPEGRDDNLKNNKASAFVAINPPSGIDTIEIKKDVDKVTANVGEWVVFTMKVTNRGFPKKFELRDAIPTYDSVAYKIFESTIYGFVNAKILSYSATNSKSVDCFFTNHTRERLLECKTKEEFLDGEGFVVKVRAKVNKRGRLCNTAFVFKALSAHATSKSEVCIEAFGNNPPTIDKIPTQEVIAGEMYKFDLSKYVHDVDENETLSYYINGLPDGLEIDSESGVISGITDKIGTYTLTLRVEDSYGATAFRSFILKVKAPPIKATDNYYKTPPGVRLDGNVISDDTGDGKDEGVDLKVIFHTKPSHGTLSIQENGEFSYYPDSGFIGVDSFTYKIEDKFGKRDSAEVKIEVNTDYIPGYHEFKLINPPNTRNVIGNFVILGNTLECVTQKSGEKDESDSFNGECQNSHNYYNNKFMTKYIDIDGDSGEGAFTWNSSSSNFTLPNSYEKDGGKGILWAAIFWQGSVNNYGERNYKQRRAYPTMGGYSYKYITKNETIDLKKSGADKILLKIDNSSYIQVKASTFYFDKKHGEFGGYYAAYADVTSLLQSMKLKRGKHKVTVANVLANEGREKDNGNYAGWSMVIIYKEDFFKGKARNISIFNGYAAIHKGNKSQRVLIKGFKLPKEGKIEAKFGAFVGEGEYYWGSHPGEIDKMVLKRDLDEEGDVMPGVDDPNNIFDSKLANIDRDNILNNNLENTNGIDIDIYDVSDIVTKYREEDPNINQLYIEIYSNEDYITASMMAFATDLYIPQLCYDYDVRLNNGIKILSSNREFEVPNVGEPLLVKIFIRNQESDFNLEKTKMSLSFTPKKVLKYIKGASEVSYKGVNDYLPAIETDPKAGEIAIGHDLSVNGGTFGAFESFYAKMRYEFLKNYFKGKFDIQINGEVVINSDSKIPYALSTKAAPNTPSFLKRCPINPTYNPLYGIFNVERKDSTFSMDQNRRYPLYTQVTGRGYRVSVASYQLDKESNSYTAPFETNATVEVELIDAGSFENNASAGYDSTCEEPSAIGEKFFVSFKGKDRVTLDIPASKNIYALRMAAFRVWYLTKEINGTNKRKIVIHNCKNAKDDGCFKDLYEKVYEKGEDKDKKRCYKACKGMSFFNKGKCYECLKRYFAKPVCSRDVFSIRPETYNIVIYDNNEGNSSVKVEAGNNNNKNHIKLSSGYIYSLEGVATKYKSNEKAKGYNFKYLTRGDSNETAMEFIGSSSCFDKEKKRVRVSFFDGELLYHDFSLTTPLNGIINNNVGEYKFAIVDKEWTKIDQKDFKYNPYKSEDCLMDSSKVVPYDLSKNSRDLRVGCIIDSDYDSSHKMIYLTFYPYRFDIASLEINSNLDPLSSFIYQNDLELTKARIVSGDIMALRLKGVIKAVGKNGVVNSNFTNSCMARDIKIKLDNIFTPSKLIDVIGNRVAFKYALFDGSIDNLSTLNIKEFNSSNEIDFQKYRFLDSLKGVANINLYMNFRRYYNVASNPSKVDIKGIKVYNASLKSIASLNKNHYPIGDISANKSFYFYYGRVIPTKSFYDDIENISVKTPIKFTIYCDLDEDKCKDFKIDVSKGIAHSYGWYWATQHDINKDGKLTLITSPSNLASVTPQINSLKNGLAKDVEVRDDSNNTIMRPFTVTIKSGVDSAPWLLYYQWANKIPPYLYKVRFVPKNATWSGVGKTGHAIESNGEGRRSHRTTW
ncbi:MAG: hypothetical protein GXO02_05955, partial [Epsilonproteobacteria bacterium]|nr:hypothetical protein [Campylobacterota bacterium]